MKLVILESLGVEKEQFFQIAREYLGDKVEIEYYGNRSEEEAVLIDRAKDADIVMLSNIPFTEKVMKECPNLKMLCVAFTGTDHIDMDYCRKNNIIVSNASGYATVAVAELVYGLVLALYRRIIQCNTVTRQEGTKEGLVGYELKGKTLGVVGTGKIGADVARIGKAFGCDVLLYSRSENLKETGMKYVKLEELLAKSDIVSLHVPLTAETKGLIGREEIALMKEDAILINTARGPVVNSVALADALNAGEIAGAGIDVFDTEPPIDQNDPLLNARNTIVTPHVAFATKESMVKRANISFENVKAFLDDKPINIVK